MDLNTTLANSNTQLTNMSVQIQALKQAVETLSSELKAFEATAITNKDMPAIFEDVDKHAAAAHQQIVTSEVVILFLAFCIIAYGKSQKWW